MRTKILAATTAAAALMLSACGGGDSAPASAGNTLSGTAAVGAPIIKGNVSVVCAGGSPLAATTASNGAWQVTTSGQMLPCAVQVSGGTVGASANVTPYHSIAMSFGTVNITPLTDLVIARLAGKAPNAWFGGLNAAALQGVTDTALANALKQVNTALGLGATLNGANPLSTAFAATNGNLLDDILEAIAKARQTASLNHAELLALAAGSTFTVPANFNFSTAYAAVKAANGGGSGATTCTAGQTSLSYEGSGPYQSGQKVCFTASTTSLAFAGKTLTSPTKNAAVAAPYSAYDFVDGAYTYEVIFKSGALHEINVSEGGKFSGQFAPAASGGTSGTGGDQAGITLSKSVGGISSLANTVVTTSSTTNDAGTTHKGRWGNTLDTILVMTSHAVVPNFLGASYESLAVNVAKVGAATMSAQLANTSGGVCMLSWTGTSMPSVYKRCADLGVSYNRTTGAVTFTNTSMTDMVGSQGTFTLSGGLNFTPY